MSNNNVINNQQQKLTPEQSLQLLSEVAALPLLKLSLGEHGAVQQALATLKAVVEQHNSPVLTPVPESDTN